jgi:transposase-like protein
MPIMETMGRKQPRARRSFTTEFKAEIVELCQCGDRSVGQVARNFDLTETAVREWVRQAERDAGRWRADQRGTPGAVGPAPREPTAAAGCGGPQASDGALKERVFDAAILVDALRRIAEGECVIDPTIVSRLVGRRRRDDPLICAETAGQWGSVDWVEWCAPFPRGGVATPNRSPSHRWCARSNPRTNDLGAGEERRMLGRRGKVVHGQRTPLTPSPRWW